MVLVRLPSGQTIRRGRSKAGRRRLMRKRTRVPFSTPMFSEAVNLGVLPVDVNATGNGGVLSFKMNDITESIYYSQLYSQYKIHKVQVTLLPRLTEVASDQLATGGNNFYNHRLIYAVQDQPEISVPANELAVLEMNGCKFRTGGKVIKINCYPKPVITVTDAINATQVGMSDNKPKWFNFDNKGDEVFHSGIAYWATLPGGGPGAPASVGLYDIYAKIYFTCRDPR